MARRRPHHVRVFHLWPPLEPNRTLVRATVVAQLVQLRYSAAEFDLDVLADGIRGQLRSGRAAGTTATCSPRTSPARPC